MHARWRDVCTGHDALAGGYSTPLARDAVQY